MSLNLFLAFSFLGIAFMIYALFQWTYGDKRRAHGRQLPARKNALTNQSGRPFLVSSQKPAHGSQGSPWGKCFQTRRESEARMEIQGAVHKTGKEPIMLKRTSTAWAMTGIVVLVATWTILGTAVAQKASVPKPQERLNLGDAEVKQLLLIMDTDKNGKISKEEWMTFMEAEFDRLDKAKNGQLDVKELAQSQLRVSRFSSVGK
jgi:hypothetical protein